MNVNDNTETDKNKNTKPVGIEQSEITHVILLCGTLP